MIRRCDGRDFEVIWAIINDGAQAYKGTISCGSLDGAYMSREKLQKEIDEGVVFWGYEEGGELAGVMGIQEVRDVTLVRHAYVRTSSRARNWGEVAVAFAGTGEQADIDWHVGGCGVGDSVL